MFERKGKPSDKFDAAKPQLPLHRCRCSVSWQYRGDFKVAFRLGSWELERNMFQVGRQYVSTKIHA